MQTLENSIGIGYSAFAHLECPLWPELKRTELSVRQERAILVGVILPKSTADPRDPLGELASLAKTAGAKVVGTMLQRRQRIDAGTYVGSGKAMEIAALAIKEKADVIIFDNDLSPGQIGGAGKNHQRRSRQPASWRGSKCWIARN